MGGRDGSELGFGEQVLGQGWFCWGVVEFRVHMRHTGQMSLMPCRDRHLEHGEGWSRTRQVDASRGVDLFIHTPAHSAVLGVMHAQSELDGLSAWRAPFILGITY